jgi:hypothetical protein
MRDDWNEPTTPPKGEPAPKAEQPTQQRGVASGEDIDSLLNDYERRKQQDAERVVRRALEIETARRKGSEAMRKHALEHAREVSGRLRQAGHRVVYQELLEAYPPSLRLHLYPKTGPMDLEEPRRWTLEFTWGDPDPDRLCARRWTSTGLADMVDLGSVPANELDELWVREQFLSFVRNALALS